MVDATQPTAGTLTPEGAQAKREERAEAFRGEPPFTEVAARGSPLAIALRDAAVAALIAAALLVFFLGLDTTIVPGGLALQTHWRPLLVAVGLVFAGRLLLTLFFWGPRSRVATGHSVRRTSRRPLAARAAARIGGL